MSHASWFSIKVRLLHICKSCKAGKVREERTPIVKEDDKRPDQEMIRVFCPHCNVSQKTRKRKIRR